MTETRPFSDLMPDEALTRLERAGFVVRVQDETLLARLENRPVRKSEVAAVLGCETTDLSQAEEDVEVRFR